MPSFFLRQPNGLYGRFSTVVAEFTAMNLTRAEALAEAKREWGDRTGADKIARAKRDEDPRLGPRDGLGRWRWAIDTIRCIHDGVQAKRRQEMGEQKP